jgi:hypothetical protein
VQSAVLDQLISPASAAGHDALLQPGASDPLKHVSFARI